MFFFEKVGRSRAKRNHTNNSYFLKWHIWELNILNLLYIHISVTNPGRPNTEERKNLKHRVLFKVTSKGKEAMDICFVVWVFVRPVSQ